MKTNKTSITSEVRAEQVTNAPPYEVIYLGVDMHKASLTVTRIIDRSTPQPAQRLEWDQFWKFAQKQTTLAKKVYVVYEAGALGFWPARKLQGMKIECLVVHPQKLDPRQKRVQTDRLDSLHLAEQLQRYVLGNRRAMVPVYVPSQTEERLRLEARHRRYLAKELRALQARGQGLLLSQGYLQTSGWWREPSWSKLQPQISPELALVLADLRTLIQQLEPKRAALDQKLEASAPKELPQGLGRLTYVLLAREICNFQRFKNRRNIGGFTGLGGAVSSSGPYHLDLSINKAGSPFLRTLLVELAWRTIYWQPDYRGIPGWKAFYQKTPLSKRRRKILAVGLARQWLVDLWRWQTGQVTPQELGWKMSATE